MGTTPKGPVINSYMRGTGTRVNRFYPVTGAFVAHKNYNHNISNKASVAFINPKAIGGTRYTRTSERNVNIHGV